MERKNAVDVALEGYRLFSMDYSDLRNVYQEILLIRNFAPQEECLCELDEIGLWDLLSDIVNFELLFGREDRLFMKFGVNLAVKVLERDMSRNEVVQTIQPATLARKAAFIVLENYVCPADEAYVGLVARYIDKRFWDVYLEMKKITLTAELEERMVYFLTGFQGVTKFPKVKACNFGDAVDILSVICSMSELFGQNIPLIQK